MKQNILKINTYASSLSIINNSNLESKLFKLMLGILGILAISYIFIIGNITLNIIERTALLESEHSMSNELGDLELQYLALSSKVDLNLAYSLGFKEAKASFATRSTAGDTYALNFDKTHLSKNTSIVKLAKNEF